MMKKTDLLPKVAQIMSRSKYPESPEKRMDRMVRLCEPRFDGEALTDDEAQALLQMVHDSVRDESGLRRTEYIG